MADKNVRIVAEVEVRSGDSGQKVADIKNEVAGIGEAASKSSSAINETVGSLKKQMREAQNEVAALSDKFGATSKEAIAAAKRAAELKDRIGDAKALTDAFNPDAKFKALSSSLSGVAGGFSAVQGAIGLFGKESKEVEKQLLRVQSALALSQGLQSIGESIDSFKQLGAVIKTQVVTAFSTLRGAIIATGVGALAIALGLIVTNFDKVKKAVLSAVPGLEKIGNLIGKIVTKVTDFVGVTSVQDREFQKLVKTTERANETIDQRIKLLEAQGNKEAEVYKLQKQRNENELNVLRAKIKLTGELTDEEQKRFRELKNESAVLDVEEQTRLKKLQEKPKEVKKVSDEEIEIIRVANQGIAQLENEKNQLTIDGAVVTKNIVIDTNKILNKEQIELLLQQAADEQAIRDAKLNAQLEYYSLIGSGLGQLSNLFDKNTAASKTAALAEIAIQTGVSFAQGLDIAQKSARGTGPGAVFAFPIFYASQVAAILATINKAKGILSTVKGGGSIPSVSGGGVPKISPSAPLQPQVQTTTLNQGQINQIGSFAQAPRAYVVESDVTSAQERANRLNRAATIE